MTSFPELVDRCQKELRFSRQEALGVLAVMATIAFIFTFRDWGFDQFDLLVGLRNFFMVALITLISLVFRITCQKIYSLTEGYKAEFNTFWVGLAISLIVAFISVGFVPIFLVGAMTHAFMVRYRLGEFRYGWSMWNNGMIAMWAVLGNLILALFAGLGWFFFPESYFFSKALQLNLLLAFYALIPIPQLDGINLFFGSRGLYYFAIALVLLAAVLLLSKTAIGLIIAFAIGIIYTTIYTLISSEK